MTELPDPRLRPPPRGKDLPTEDGVPMETPKHRLQMTDLIHSLEDGLARQDRFIGGNMFLYFSELQSKQNDFRGPDFFVVLGVSSHDRPSWVVWEEGGRAPDLVIELLSSSTEAVDRGQKMTVYAQILRVPMYVLFDPEDGRLEVYHLELEPSPRYARAQANAAGRYGWPATGLELGIVDDRQSRAFPPPWLRWFTAEGALLPTPTEGRAHEAERAEVERQRADRLEAELAALRSRQP